MYNEIDRTCKQVVLLVYLETEMLKLEIGNKNVLGLCGRINRNEIQQLISSWSIQLLLHCHHNFQTTKTMAIYMGITRQRPQKTELILISVKMLKMEADLEKYFIRFPV